MSGAPKAAGERWEDARIKALVMDPVSSMPVVILEGEESGRLLPIWIGLCEANAIALPLEHVATPRPMTHDLLASVIRAAGYTVRSVSIHSLQNDVFHATIHLEPSNGGAPVDTDSRPSDALALAVRTGAPVRVASEVLEQAGMESPHENEVIRTILEKLRPEDLGRWEM